MLGTLRDDPVPVVQVVYSGAMPCEIEGIWWVPGVAQAVAYDVARCLVGKHNLRLKLASLTRPVCTTCDEQRRRTERR